MKRAFVFFFAMALSLSSLCANATAKDNWLRIRSKNFTFVGNAGQGDMRKVAVRLELFREVFAQIFPSTKLSASVPTTVLIFRTDSSQWPYPILRYLKGAITETQLIAASKYNDQLTESHAYVEFLSAAGKREEALTHLRWVRDNGNKRFVEYPLALRELERLEGAGKMSDKL